jgi:hypothetical protein
VPQADIRAPRARETGGQGRSDNLSDITADFKRRLESAGLAKLNKSARGIRVARGLGGCLRDLSTLNESLRRKAELGLEFEEPYIALRGDGQGHIQVHGHEHSYRFWPPRTGSDLGQALLLRTRLGHIAAVVFKIEPLDVPA